MWVGPSIDLFIYLGVCYVYAHSYEIIYLSFLFLDLFFLNSLSNSVFLAECDYYFDFNHFVETRSIAEKLLFLHSC